MCAQSADGYKALSETYRKAIGNPIEHEAKAMERAEEGALEKLKRLRDNGRR